MEHDEYELTGWEEHQDFEAGREEYEVSVMRYEAQEAARYENLIYEMEQEELQAAWDAQQADPMRAECHTPDWRKDRDCRIGGHDNFPF
jgi:hypothetical protein